MSCRLEFTTDSERFNYFVPESKEHSAKLEIRTLQWIVEHYSKPGDTILDPMSGIGTVHLAATMGRNTIAIELIPRYCEIQGLNLEMLDRVLGITGTTQVINMDCRRFLPLEEGKINLIVFSPPYGSLFAQGKTSRGGWKIGGQVVGYEDNTAAIGQLKTYPQYLHAMLEVMKLCNRSLRVGQRMILITQDYVQNYRRIFVSKDNIRVAVLDCGFSLEDWHIRVGKMNLNRATHSKWRAQKGFSREELDISDEDILVFTKVTAV